MPTNEPSVTDQWEEAYKNLAIEFDATLSDRPDEITHLHNALLVIIGLNSSDYGTEAATQILNPMDLLYRHARQHYSYDTWRNRVVRLINNFTIKYYGDLTIFVNSLPWPDECIPYYWYQLSETNGFDTSGWNVCS